MNVTLILSCFLNEKHYVCYLISISIFEDWRTTKVAVQIFKCYALHVFILHNVLNADLAVSFDGIDNRQNDSFDWGFQARSRRHSTALPLALPNDIAFLVPFSVMNMR